MKILFLGQRDRLEPWYADVVAAVGEQHEVMLYDRERGLAEQFQDARVVVDQGGSVGTGAMIDAAAEAGVRLWQVLGTGMDHVDVPYIVSKGLSLANTPGPFSSVALAEHALLFMLYFAKSFPASQRHLREGTFSQLMNEELDGRTLGLVGLGASARELAKRAWPMGMRMVAVDVARPSQDVCDALHVEFLGGPERLDSLLGRADYVSIHAPLTSKTRHMIDRRALALMRPSAVLINVARGDIVDGEALGEVLERGGIKGAGLDVFAQEPLDPAHPLLRLPNVVATPHIAGVTFGTSRRRAQAVADNIARVAGGLAPLWLISDVE